MKKVLFFAAVAATMVACSNEELNVATEQAAIDNNEIAFSVYAPRSTRAGVANDITNTNIKDNATPAGKAGFGVFAYYTAGETYSENAKPNFMYNQQVTYQGTEGWKYEPVKYWPNEFGNAAISDDVDYVTFFTYAPWTEFDPTTGLPILASTLTPAEIEKAQNYNIVSTIKNTSTGDPMIKYAVDTDPATSVDLLWGTCANEASYAPIAENANIQNKKGLPFINMLKPNNPNPGVGTVTGNRLNFNLRHALSRVKVTIQYVADANTPLPADIANTATINADETRIFVRSLTLNGFAMKGALNLNNTDPFNPLWKDFDGTKDLTFADVSFYDGRKDGKEGDVNGEQANEKPQGLNPVLLENYAQTEAGKFAATKNAGITKDPVLVFGGDESVNDGYFYVIPRNEGSDVDIQLVYDVETIDANLAEILSDGVTHGSSIENVINKYAIFGNGIDFEPGKSYQINILVGMTSVKIEASVTDWPADDIQAVPELPANQQYTVWTTLNPVLAGSIAGNFTGAVVTFGGEEYREAKVGTTKGWVKTSDIAFLAAEPADDAAVAAAVTIPVYKYTPATRDELWAEKDPAKMEVLQVSGTDVKIAIYKTK